MRLRKSTSEIGETQVEATPKTKKSNAKAASAKRQQKVATPAPQDQTPVSNKKSKKRKSGILVEDVQKETDISPVKESSPPKKQKKSTEVKQTADQNGTGRSGGDAKVEGKSPSKKKKTKPQQAAADARPSANGQILAVEYLHMWKKSKGPGSKKPGGVQWRFQKVRQVWLLHNMLDSNSLPDDDFETLLEYLKGLQGKSKQLTSDKMESLIQEFDDKMQKTEGEEEAEGDKDSLKKLKSKWKRASSVLQTLT